MSDRVTGCSLERQPGNSDLKKSYGAENHCPAIWRVLVWVAGLHGLFCKVGGLTEARLSVSVVFLKSSRCLPWGCGPGAMGSSELESPLALKGLGGAGRAVRLTPCHSLIE